MRKVMCLECGYRKEISEGVVVAICRFCQCEMVLMGQGCLAGKNVTQGGMVA